MADLKNVGELHLARGNYVLVKTPDHDREFMLTLNDSGLLSLVATPTEAQAAVCLVRVYPTETERAQDGYTGRD